MITLIKTLSIIVFKRLFEKYSFILFFPKIFLNKFYQKDSITLKKYLLKYSYSCININLNNIALIFFFSKLNFLKMLFQYYFQICSIKFHNIFFNKFCLIYYQKFFFSSLTHFFFKIWKFFFNNVKYIFSFRRILKIIK